MSCCGKKRDEIRQRRTTYVPSSSAPAAIDQDSTPVVFQGVGAYLVTGQHSRKVYHFSQMHPEQSVDAKDAAALLRTRLFHAIS